MNCRRVGQRLSSHLEGRLAEREARRVAAHLKGCPGCLRLRDELAAVGRELRELPGPLPAPGLRRRAIERWIAEGETGAPLGRRGSFPTLARPPVGGTAPVAMAASVLLLLAVLGLSLSRRSDPPPIQQPARSLARAPLPVAPELRKNGGKTRPVESRSPSTMLATGPAAIDAATRPVKHPNTRTPQRLNARTPGRETDDLAYVNRNVAATAEPTLGLSRGEWDHMEARVRRAIQVHDDFVLIPLPRLASASNAQVAAAIESYKSEAAVVDSRLSREVTLAVKATALSDLCDQLRADTGIRLEAGRSVADQKVTVFCEKLPLRDVMRQLARPFGYAWLRSPANAPRSMLNAQPDRPSSIEHRASSIDYRYELVQDLRSQLLEEELRNRDRNAALLALDREMSRYRQYLNLSPDEALMRARGAPPAEKKLLEHYAASGWGVAQLYFRLTPSDLAALRSGQQLRFSAAPQPGEQPLPPELARGVLQSLRHKRVVMQDGRYQVRDAATAPDGIPLTSGTEVRARVTLWMGQTELGQFKLDGDAGLTLRTDKGTSNYAEGSPLAVGVSSIIRNPQNRVANAGLARAPSLRKIVTVSGVQAPRTEGEKGRGGEGESRQRRAGLLPGSPSPPLPFSPSVPERLNVPEKVTSADVLEAIHRASGLPIVADYYTRLYAPRDLAVQQLPLFDALNHVADALQMRWSRDGVWLQFRSASFFNDRLKEVPNRLLARWAALRREHGALRLDDLLEIVQLSDAQLDGAEMGEGARVLWGLEEWSVARDRSPRPHLRFLATFPPPQRQAALSPAGLAFTAMSLAQQQQFIALALGSQADKLPSLNALSEAAMRVDYMLPGAFQWQPPAVPDGPFWRTLVPSTARGPTREAALQAAIRIDPRAEPAQIVPTELALTITHWLGGPEKGFSKPFVLRVDGKGNHGVRAAVFTP